VSDPEWKRWLSRRCEHADKFEKKKKDLEGLIVTSYTDKATEERTLTMLPAIESEFLRRMHWTVHTHFHRSTTSDWTDSEDEESNEACRGSLPEEQNKTKATTTPESRSPLGCNRSVIAKTRSLKGSKKFFELRKEATQAMGFTSAPYPSVDAQILMGSDSPVCSRPSSVSFTLEPETSHDLSCPEMAESLQPIESKIIC
jgi:hypothetical protein